MKPCYDKDGVTLYCGDCVEVMKNMADNSVDAIVCDPPAGISFMSKTWDQDKGGRDQWIEWLASVMTEARRVLKPGGHALIWALPRTSHWTAMAIEDAGFDVRDCLYHMFATGFPKSLNVQQAINKAERGCPQGASDPESPNHGKFKSGCSGESPSGRGFGAGGGAFMEDAGVARGDDEGKWQGWGTALKPAAECWWICRAPLSEGTVAANVLKWGTGAINIDGCRVGGIPWKPHDATCLGSVKYFTVGETPIIHKEPHAQGRFPANLIWSHHPECQCAGTEQVKGSPTSKTFHEGYDGESVTGFVRGVSHPGNQHSDENGMETVEKWICHPDCPSQCFPDSKGQQGDVQGTEQSKTGAAGAHCYGEYERVGFSKRQESTASASRFFYSSKPSKRERHIGCQDLFWDIRGEHPVLIDKDTWKTLDKSQRAHGNIHPTLKGCQLMAYLCRLVTPPGGIVLDPFCGSGSTILAAEYEGFQAIGIEQDKAYIEIAKCRVGKGWNPDAKPAPKKVADLLGQQMLF